jgi:predicted O-methyltransferase YrrM
MASAMAPLEGHVLSIALDDDDIVRSSLELLRDAHVDGLHALMRENSNLALTRLHLDGRRFDFIYMDGWKTFDHVVFEIYLFNQILDVGGTIVFDDAYMPAVDQAIKVLVSHYEYEEIDYRKHNQTAKLRAFQILTRGSLKRPYRAFRKQKAISEQSAFRDYRFYRQV